MKKLLAITLVLGLAAAANAVTVTPSALEVEQGSTVSIVITSDGPYAGYIELTDAVAGSLTGAMDAGTAGGLAELNDPTAVGFANNWGFVAAGAPGSEVVAGADHFTFTYTANDDSSLVQINIYDINWDVPTGDSFAIQNTPEPMTLGLLGLGGLFLRRRK